MGPIQPGPGRRRCRPARGGRLPFVPDPLAALVYLPFARTSGLFFGVELFYRPYAGFELGEFVRTFGQWYVTILFVLVVSVPLVDLEMWARSIVDGIR